MSDAPVDDSRQVDKSILPPIGCLHTSFPDAIAAALRRRILGGVLRAGERLTESRLCDQLGVSRIPVREALRTLAAEGLIDVAPRRGATVAHLSPTVVQDLVNVHARSSTPASEHARLALWPP
jgi:DNA-binding GntR family transcriptional regulator